MAISNRLAQRARLMLARQPESRWLRDYDPAIHAVREEAPRSSRPRLLDSAKLGRYVHLLSAAEEAVALVVLHNPAVFDVHEQRILHTEPCVHPLHNHPQYSSPRLPHLRGTVAVADALGLLREHATFVDPASGAVVPFPYVGDLLIFISDTEGAFAVNINIKHRMRDFQRRGPGLFYRPQVDDDESAKARLAIEETYYADAEIRCVRASGEEVDEELRCNLHLLFTWHCRPVAIANETRKALVETFAGSVGTDAICWDVITKAARELGVSNYDAKAVLMQGIWDRTLLVDLYSSILVDAPLKPATRDVIADHASWFARRWP